MIQSIPIKIKKLHPEAQLPKHGNENAAGFDLYSIEEGILQPGEVRIFATGIAMSVPVGKVFHVWDRSGMGVRGITTFGGVIDSDYRGEVKIILFNATNSEKWIQRGDRIAQGVIMDYYKAEFNEVSDLEESERGENWNNSSGR